MWDSDPLPLHNYSQGSVLTGWELSLMCVSACCWCCHYSNLANTIHFRCVEPGLAKLSSRSQFHLDSDLFGRNLGNPDMIVFWPSLSFVSCFVNWKLGPIEIGVTTLGRLPACRCYSRQLQLWRHIRNIESYWNSSSFFFLFYMI